MENRASYIVIKVNIQMTNRYEKKCSISVLNREMKIIAKMRQHLTLVKMAISKRPKGNNCWWIYGVKGTYNALVIMYISIALIEHNMEGIKKVINRTSVWSVTPTTGLISKENETSMSLLRKRHLYSNVYCSTIHTSQEMQSMKGSTND